MQRGVEYIIPRLSYHVNVVILVHNYLSRPGVALSMHSIQSYHAMEHIHSQQWYYNELSMKFIIS
jgi:hypothetical protein